MRHRSSRFLSACRFGLALAATIVGSTVVSLDARAQAANAPLQGPPGMTALSGLVLAVDGTPLPNVTIKDGGSSAVTDATGHFLLTYAPVGSTTMVIDGRKAGNIGATDYGYYEVQVYAQRGKTRGLPFTSWLTPIDHANDVTIVSPTAAETIVRTPKVPNLEVHIPAGTVITDPDGNRVTKVSITQIPVDRPPFPLPAGIKVPIYFTTQPGGAKLWTATGGQGQAQIWYPNYYDALPRSGSTLWDYDPDKGGWRTYGTATVNASGKTFVPKPDAVIYRFSGAMINTGTTPPPSGPPCNDDCSNATDGDPVDLATGLFVESHTDLSLADVMPVNLSRTYQSGDTNDRTFGVGMTLSYDMYLYANSPPTDDNYQAFFLILPNGTRVPFTRIANSPISKQIYNATFISNSAPGKFYGATMTLNAVGRYWDMVLKDGTHYAFGENTPLQWIQDRFGHRVTVTRSGGLSTQSPPPPVEQAGRAGPVVQVASPNGRFVALSYDVSNHVYQAQDDGGRIVCYYYTNPTGPGCPVTGTPATGTTLTNVVDPNLGVTTYTWADGELTSITDPKNFVAVTNAYTFWSNCNVPVVTQQTLAIATSVYSFTYPGASGTCTNQSPVPVISQTNVTDPNGATNGTIRVVTFNSSEYVLTDDRAVCYNSNPNCPSPSIRQNNTYTRDSATNLPVTFTDALGRVTTWIYDTQGSSNPCSQGSTPITLGNVTCVTQANLTGFSNTLTTQFTYSPNFNQVTSITDPLGDSTQYLRDALDEVTSIIDAQNNTTTLCYVPGTSPASCLGSGQVYTVTDPLLNMTTFTYDHFDVASKTDALNRTWTIYTDALGRPVIATDPLADATKVTYDPIYGVHLVTDPLGNLTKIFYNPDGQVSNVTDASNNSTTFLYDAMDRLTQRKDPLGNIDKITQYDPNSNSLSAIDRNGNTISFTWDALNRRSSATYIDSSVNYSWDSANRLTQVVDSMGGTITRGYDGLDDLTSETMPQGSVTTVYDAARRPQTMTAGSQAQVSYTFNSANWLTRITQGSASVVLGHNADGLITRWSYPNGVIGCQTFDKALEVKTIGYFQSGQISDCPTPTGTVLGIIAYGYDLAGRVNSLSNTEGTLFQSVLPASIASANYNSDNQLTQLVNANGATNFGYDLNGNMLSAGSASYSWDARNRLLTAPGMTNAVYDTFGRRQSASFGTNAMSWLYDKVNPVQEISSVNGTANLLNGLDIDQRFTRAEGSNTATYLSDRLGSTLALTNSSGAIQTSYNYDPYGNTTSTGTTTDNAYQFTGRQNDGTGLFYYRTRYYNPSWGRFLNQDPFGFRGGPNLYGYVRQSPITKTDPLGLDPPLPLGPPGPAPNFLVSPGGTVYPIPDGSTGPYETYGRGGLKYENGSGGGDGLSCKTTGFRYMPPGMSGPYPYPDGRGMYNDLSGRTVNPFTGEGIPVGDPFAHIGGGGNDLGLTRPPFE